MKNKICKHVLQFAMCLVVMATTTFAAGKYLEGWDVLREARQRRQIQMGLVDAKWPLAPREANSPAWSDMPEDDRKQFDDMMAIYAAMIDTMDRSVGMLVDGLRERGQLNNTLILFVSDNSGNAESVPNGRYEGNNPGDAHSNVFLGQNWATLNNTPFRKWKHYVHEGGSATPLIAHKDRPFFAYFSFYDVHTPLMAREDLRKKYEEKRKRLGITDKWGREPERDVRLVQDHAVYAAMVQAMDQAVGKVLTKLDELGLSENTLVFFTSDNGPITAGGQDPEFFNSNGPLRDLKFTLLNGIRVPCLVRWPNRIVAGSTSHHVSDFADMLPTLAELVGAQAPAALDGVSIVPTLLGQFANQKVRGYHYGEAAPAQALRQGDWKVYRGASNKPIELYNLRSELGETRDVASKNPEIVARLEALMAQAHVESAEFPLAAKKKQQP